MTGKQIMITGGTSGIGLAAAEALAALGENIVIVGRNETRTKIAAARIRATAAKGATVGTLIADLASQGAVRKLAAGVVGRYPRVDVLINNAGAMYTTRQVTNDGIELTWAVNHLAPFLLTTLLLDGLKTSTPSRIITTSSEAHQGADIPFDDLNAEKSYGGFARYKQTKLANILFTSELARRLSGSGVTAHCFHPGLVASGFNRNNGLLMNLAMTMLWPMSRSAEKGAETLVASHVGGCSQNQRRVLRRHGMAAAKPAGTERAGCAASLGDQRGTVRRERHLALNEIPAATRGLGHR
jgi:NAD(P)-dependent dehydrogenase (short-subunit alcohol dehydrogenase family)